MVVTVAEEGNKRKGAASSEDLKQCVLDICSWFNRNGLSLREVEGASTADFQRLAKGLDQDIPMGLRILLSEVNGHIWFMDKQLLSADEIVRKVGELESNSGWRANLIPFCGDESGMLVVNSSTEEVLEWDADDGLGDAVAGSFAQYLETFRDSLLAGRVEYLDGAGVIEKVSGGRRK